MAQGFSTAGMLPSSSKSAQNVVASAPYYYSAVYYVRAVLYVVSCTSITTIQYPYSFQFGPVLPAQASLHDNQPRHLHYDGEDDLRSETDTCREEYNYKYPHECKVEKDCVFVVKWHVLEEEEGSGEEEEKEECWVQFDVTASLAGIAVNESSPVWVALGFSSDSTMVG